MLDVTMTDYKMYHIIKHQLWLKVHLLHDIAHKDLLFLFILPGLPPPFHHPHKVVILVLTGQDDPEIPDNVVTPALSDFPSLFGLAFQISSPSGEKICPSFSAETLPPLPLPLL